MLAPFACVFPQQFEEIESHSCEELETDPGVFVNITSTATTGSRFVDNDLEIPEYETRWGNFFELVSRVSAASNPDCRQFRLRPAPRAAKAQV